MATTKKVTDSTAAVIPSANESDIKMEQTETVVINGKVTQIKRGEYVDVKVPVFLQLKQRYPSI